MAIKKVGGGNPYAGQVMTTQGYRAPRPPLCLVCGQRKEGQIYTINGNGQQVCADCAGEKHAQVLKACANGAGDDCACHDEPEEDGE